MESSKSNLFGLGADTEPLSVVWRDKSAPDVYEEARVGRLFNFRRPKRYPPAIVSVKAETDVVKGVELAIKQKCRISVRAGGHSWAAWSVRDDAILLDLGGYSEIVLDEATGIVRVSPSTTSRDLVSHLASKGRVVSAGHCPDVGMGGFLLGGGMGWNCNNWGWACEQIVAVDVVTANGQLLQANAQKHSDLFWAAKGAGPGFPAVVTRFHLQTRPSPKVMRSSRYVYPMSEFRDAFNWILKVPSGHDEGIEIVAIGSFPPGSNEPCITIAVVGFGGDEEAIKTVLQRIEDSHPPGAVSHSFYQETSLDQEFNNREKSYETGSRYCVDNAFLKNGADVAAVLEPAFVGLPTKTSKALWSSMIPCSRRKLPEMAASLQSDHYFALYGVWEQEGDDSRCQAWVGNVMAEVGRHSVGAYLGEYDFEARPSKFWGDDEAKRIVDVRKKWDPEGRICGYLGLEDAETLMTTI